MLWLAMRGSPSPEIENQREMLESLAASPLTEHLFTDELTWVITGVEATDYNGVLRTRLAGADCESRIANLLQTFRRRGLPFTWYLDEETQPPDTERMLVDRGCSRLEQEIFFAADLAHFSDAGEELPGFCLQRVLLPDDLKHWMSIWAQFGEGAPETRERLYLSLGLSGRHPLRHYLARLNGKPVGIAQLFLGRKTVGVYGLAIQRKYQHRGLGTALVSALMRDARAMGYRIAVAIPAPGAQKLYERVGFQLFPSVCQVCQANKVALTAAMS